jgi:hypothetical protein
MLATFLRGTGDSLVLEVLLHSVFNRTNNDNGTVATLTAVTPACSPWQLARFSSPSESPSQSAAS